MALCLASMWFYEAWKRFSLYVSCWYREVHFEQKVNGNIIYEVGNLSIIGVINVAYISNDSTAFERMIWFGHEFVVPVSTEDWASNSVWLFEEEQKYIWDTKSSILPFICGQLKCCLPMHVSNGIFYVSVYLASFMFPPLNASAHSLSCLLLFPTTYRHLPTARGGRRMEHLKAIEPFL